MKNTCISSLYNMVYILVSVLSQKRKKDPLSEKRLHVCESHAQHMT